jgi:hypothetical protein
LFIFVVRAPKSGGMLSPQDEALLEALDFHRHVRHGLLEYEQEHAEDEAARAAATAALTSAKAAARTAGTRLAALSESDRRRAEILEIQDRILFARVALPSGSDDVRSVASLPSSTQRPRTRSRLPTSPPPPLALSVSSSLALANGREPPSRAASSGMSMDRSRERLDPLAVLRRARSMQTVGWGVDSCTPPPPRPVSEALARRLHARAMMYMPLR